MKHSATLESQGCRLGKQACRMQRSTRSSLGPSSPEGSPDDTTHHGCWPGRCRTGFRMRSGCMLHLKLRTLSVCPCHVQQCAKNLKMCSCGIMGRAPQERGSWPKKHSGQVGRPGGSNRLWPVRQPRCLHTGVSSATFFRSPAASGEWWASSGLSASRIFRWTFWFVLLHSEYSWQW